MVIRVLFLLLSLLIFTNAYTQDFDQTSDGYYFASDGDLVDCVDMKKQPAFRNPLLKNHKIQEVPSEYPTKIKTIKKSKWGTREAKVSTVKCPKGTVPVRHDGVTLDRQTEPETAGSTPVHEYAVISTKTPSKLYGAKAVVNVWDPAIEGADEMSISQIWISSGQYRTKDINTIEIGWQVYPSLYLDNKPRLFIFWTRDTYRNGCYNLQCGGFIQTSSSVVLGGSITPVSTFGGNQYEISILVWKDRKKENWWLSLGPHNLVVGYWPAELFTTLSDHADTVEFGGEVSDSYSFGRHTRTQMGSGHFSDEGFGNTSYFRNMEVVDDNNRLRPIQDLRNKVTNPKWYDIKDRFTDDWGTHVFYGGSGFKPSGAISLASDPIFFYFFLSFCLYGFMA